MLSFLAEMRELVTAIRIQEHVGGTLWDRALRPPLPSLIALPSPNCKTCEIWDVAQRPQGEQIDNPDIVAGFRLPVRRSASSVSSDAAREDSINLMLRFVQRIILLPRYRLQG